MNSVSNNTYKIRLLDGTYYTGEIAHMDDERIVLKLGNNQLQRTLQVFHDMVISIQRAASADRLVSAFPGMTDN